MAGHSSNQSTCSATGSHNIERHQRNEIQRQIKAMGKRLVQHLHHRTKDNIQRQRGNDNIFPRRSRLPSHIRHHLRRRSSRGYSSGHRGQLMQPVQQTVHTQTGRHRRNPGGIPLYRHGRSGKAHAAKESERHSIFPGRLRGCHCLKTAGHGIGICRHEQFPLL